MHAGSPIGWTACFAFGCRCLIFDAVWTARLWTRATDLKEPPVMPLMTSLTARIAWLTAPWRNPQNRDGPDRLVLSRIEHLENRMEDTTAAIAELNAETDALAARIDGVLDSVDDSTAAELRLVSARLKGIAADPADPVPADLPTEPVTDPPADGPEAAPAV